MSKAKGLARTRADLARELGCDVRTIARYLKAGLPRRKDGRFCIDECRRWGLENSNPAIREAFLSRRMAGDLPQVVAQIAEIRKQDYAAACRLPTFVQSERDIAGVRDLLKRLDEADARVSETGGLIALASEEAWVSMEQDHARIRDERARWKEGLIDSTDPADRDHRQFSTTDIAPGGMGPRLRPAAVRRHKVWSPSPYVVEAKPRRYPRSHFAFPNLGVTEESRMLAVIDAVDPEFRRPLHELAGEDDDTPTACDMRMRVYPTSAKPRNGDDNPRFPDAVAGEWGNGVSLDGPGHRPLAGDMERGMFGPAPLISGPDLQADKHLRDGGVSVSEDGWLLAPSASDERLPGLNAITMELPEAERIAAGKVFGWAAALACRLPKVAPGLVSAVGTERVVRAVVGDETGVAMVDLGEMANDWGTSYGPADVRTALIRLSMVAIALVAQRHLVGFPWLRDRLCEVLVRRRRGGRAEWKRLRRLVDRWVGSKAWREMVRMVGGVALLHAPPESLVAADIDRARSEQSEDLRELLAGVFAEVFAAHPGTPKPEPQASVHARVA